MGKIFERQRLTPSQLRTVAQRRLDDADCLRRSGDNARANGVFYVGGFVIECLLKAKMLQRYPSMRSATSAEGMSESDRRIWHLIYRLHDLDGLLDHLPEMRSALLDSGPEAGHAPVRSADCDLPTVDDLRAVLAAHGEDEGCRAVPGSDPGFEAMAQQVADIPKFLSGLVADLARRVPGAEIEVEKSRGLKGYRYTVAVVSDRFESMGWTERHRAVWNAAYENLSDADLLRVAVLAVRPSDLNGRGAAH